MIQLYDPRSNTITETSYDYLEKLTRKKKGSLRSLRSKGLKIGSINCYILRNDTTVQQRKKWYEKEKFPDEVWKPVEGSGDKFLISNYGRFKRIYKKATKLLLPFLRKKNGHLYIKVKFKEKYGEYKISHLVAHHFIGLNDKHLSVRHKNGIKTDCFSGNLEYVTPQKLGKLTGRLAKSKPVIQLDMHTGELLGEYRSAREAGRKCFLSYQAVLDNCNHKSRTSGGYVFMFTEEYEERELRDD